jgi:hypothetical protein
MSVPPLPVPVIDAHTHVFSEEIVSGRDRLLGREPWFGHLYENPKAALIGAAEQLAAMDAAGVAEAIACGFPWRDLGLCRQENDALATASRAAEGRLHWLASVPLGGGAAAAREAERAFALGAAGLGELNADGQGFDLRDAASLAPVVAVCRAADRPILLHASEPVGHAYPGKGVATPDKLFAFASALPDLAIVLAHWGGGLPFFELMPEVAAACARVVYDSAASSYLYRPAVFRAVLDVVGPGKVLWGSDHPVLGMGRFLRRTLAEAGLREDELGPVLGGNARRVYRLPPTIESGEGQA